MSCFGGSCLDSVKGDLQQRQLIIKLVVEIQLLSILRFGPGHSFGFADDSPVVFNENDDKRHNGQSELDSCHREVMNGCTLEA